jgi:hypothetical protein
VRLTAEACVDRYFQIKAPESLPGYTPAQARSFVAVPDFPLLHEVAALGIELAVDDVLGSREAPATV